MKRYVCFVDDNGFAICEPGTGKYLRSTLIIDEASDCTNKQDWIDWIAEREPLQCTILEKI